MSLDAANPFAAASPVPYQLTPWAQVRVEHYLPAVEAGITERLQELQAIADDPELPTRANVIDAWEGSGQILSRAVGAFWTVQPADTTEELDAIDAEISPKLARFSDAIYLNQALYERVRALAERADRLAQVYPQVEERRVTIALTSLVTALAMNHVHSGIYSG